MSEQRLAGKVAVVTGGARGLGQAYAERLAQDGADVAVIDLNAADETEKSVKAAGKKFFSSIGDVTEPETVEKFAADVKTQFGRCDIVVNNAGIYPFEPVSEMSFENWRKVLATDLDAPFIVSKAFLNLLKASGSGRIINVTSNTVWTVTVNFAHYISAKAGVVGLTRALATELADDKITVNCIGPSLVRTPGTEENGAVAYLENYSKTQAIHREETPQDLAGAVAFFASDDARFITGQTLIVDGGLVRL